jgi:hypothetical protein
MSVKTDVIQYKFKRLRNEEDICHYRNKIKGGMQREIDGVTGTLGVVVKAKASGEFKFLTCEHAVNNINEEYDIPPHKLDCVAIDIKKRIAGNYDYTSEIERIGRIREAVEAELGMEVRKYGNKTGLTYGTVVSIDMTAKIDGKTFEEQIGIVADLARNWKFADGGDSGSLVVNNTLNPIGLLVACNDETGIVGAEKDRNAEGIFCMVTPIQKVLDELKVDLYSENLSDIAKDIDDTMRTLVMYPPPLSEKDPRYLLLKGHGIDDYCCKKPCCP